MKKNILVISTHDTSGGAARVAREVGKGVEKKDYKVRYLVGKKSSNDPNVYELKRNTALGSMGKKFNYDFITLFRYARTYFLSNDMQYRE